MYFETNANALLKRNPRHSLLVQSLAQMSSSVEEKLALVPTPDGKECGFNYDGIWLHDATAPGAEVKKAFKASCKTRSPRVHIILGLGLGYALDYAFANSQNEIIVYEPDLALLKFTLDNVELNILLAHPRVQLATDTFELLSQLRPFIYSDYDLDFLILPGFAAKMKDEIPALVQQIKVMISDWARDYMTVKQFHPQWVRQFLENLPQFAKTLTIDSLANQFAGKPAIVIGRGPSLDAALPAIKQLQNSSVLVAAGAALHRLFDADIIPDFAIFYDANAVTEQLYGLPDIYLSAINVIVCPHTPPAIYNYAFRESYLFLAENAAQLSDWYDKALGKKHLRLEGGGTVSVIAMQLAYFMGCREIALIGQDLAFPNNQVYAGGIPLQKDAAGNMSLTASKTLFTKPHALTQVRGQQGESLETTVSYAGFVRHFEALAIQFKQLCPSIRLSNCSLGGAQINGYTLCPLSDFQEHWSAFDKQFVMKGSDVSNESLFKVQEQKLHTALSALKVELDESIRFLKKLHGKLPAKNQSLRKMEDGVWECTQMLFQHIHDHPFIGFLAMFDLIPYKQRFLALTEMGGFDAGMVDDLANTLTKTRETLESDSLLWVSQTLDSWQFAVVV